MRSVVAACLAMVSLTACSPPQALPRSVLDFTNDPAALQGVIARCDADPRAAQHDPDCETARRATEQIAKAEEAKRAAEKEREFERQRALRRERDEAAERAKHAGEHGFDPYSSPVTLAPGGDAAKP